MATKAIARTRRIYVSRPKRRSAAKMTVPVAVIAGFVPMGADILSAYRVAGAQGAIEHLALCTTGYDPSDGKFKPMFAFQKLYGPLIAGVMVHKIAGYLGVNRALGRAKVPFLRI